MHCWFLCCLALLVVFIVMDTESTCKSGQSVVECPPDIKAILTTLKDAETIDMEKLERDLLDINVNGMMSISDNGLVALLSETRGKSDDLSIAASNSEVTSLQVSGAEMIDPVLSKTAVRVHLPKELDLSINTILFCMLAWPEKYEVILRSKRLYEDRFIGLSVKGRHISNLQEPVTITMSITNVSESEEPSCVFFNFTTRNLETEGCLTEWKRGDSEVTCSCDHLTYFAVLMVTLNIPKHHREVMSYITLIGCGLSLVALVTTVVLFITQRRARSDTTLRVHINLVIALILLNAHFIPSQNVAQLHSHWFCFCMALSLHYSLLASFSWMALEGFHLYLLLIRVFNIYIRRYLFKLSLVGWGVPAVIVILVVAIDTEAYGAVHIDQTNPNTTEICYIANETVKQVTAVGPFSLVFLFNISMIGTVVRQVVALRRSRQIEKGQAKRDACSLLGVTCLLGISWGPIFFSSVGLSLIGPYLFCILNAFQGFFIFLWFCLSLKKINASVATTSSNEMQSSKG